MSFLTLREEQQSFVEYALEKIKENKFTICEMPTAFGKSISSLALAKEIVEKLEKKAIIVTSNNSLARDIFLESKKIDNLPDTCLMLGKNNYFDLDKIDDFEYFNKKRLLEVKNELLDEFEFVFIDDFLERLNINDEDDIDYIKRNFSLTDSSQNNFEEYDIQITNYAYVFSHFFYQSSDIFNDAIFIFDEIQELINSAELILGSKFSLYSYYLQFKKVQKNLQLNSLTAKSTLKLLDSYIFTLRETIEIYKTTSVQHIFDNDVSQKRANAIYEKLFNQNQSKTLEAKLKNIYKKTPNHTLSGLLYQINEAKKVLKSNDIFISYSSERGYISFSTFSKDLKTYLAFKFWDKIDTFIGVTATALLTDNPQDLNAYIRLGINLNDIRELSEKKSKLSIIKTFKGVLDPLQAQYHINKNEYIEDDDERFLFFANEIKSNWEQKNSLALVGSFDEADLLEKKLKEIKFKGNITKANKEQSTKNTIYEFKKSGGVLIGTRNYTTGINLKGEELEKLFITKLPYPVFRNKKWIDLKQKNPSFYWIEYNNEMIMTFRQEIGRLIRTPNDKGDIYLLDGKFNSLRDNLRDRLIYFLEKVSHCATN